MRRVFEARDIEHQYEIARTVIAPERRKVSAASLTKRGSVVGADQDRVARRRTLDGAPERVRIAPLRVDELDFGAVAAREATELVQIEPASSHLGQRHAAVQEIFREPAPRPLPQTTRIDPKRIQCDHERTQTTKGRVRLSMKLLLNGNSR